MIPGELFTAAGEIEINAGRETAGVDGKVVLHVAGATGVLPQVVNAAERGGFDVHDLSVTEPTLETVFIHLTGKELRD